MKYTIRQSTKGTVWVNDFFEVEADSLEEARQKVLNGEYEPYNTETDWEFWEDMEPEENDGYRTKELYHKEKLIYKNGE